MQPRDVIRCELIGLVVEVTAARNPALIGLRGVVVDETRNTLIIESVKGEKKLVKDQVTLTTNIHGKTIHVDGALLVGRPEERLKKKVNL